MAFQADEFVVVGRIAGVYGVKGWVRVESFTQPITNIFDYDPWTLLGPGGTQRQCAKAEGRPHGKGLIAKFEGLSDREEAVALVGHEVAVPRRELPEVEQGSFYWADLEGLSVVTKQGQALGQVDHLIETGANDVLVVEGERQRLIPFLWERVVLQVDLDAKRITVDWDPEF
ncbi:MAG: ribosome maturation factor RimM [Pseudomonadota bacterium]